MQLWLVLFEFAPVFDQSMVSLLFGGSVVVDFRRFFVLCVCVSVCWMSGGVVCLLLVLI